MRLWGVAVAAMLGLGGAQAGELEIGLYGGFNESAHSHGILSDGTVSQDNVVGWKGLSTTNPIYWGARLIYWPESVSDWGFGLDYTHAKAYADLVGSGIEHTYSVLEFTDGLNLLSANAFRKWDFDSGLRTYVGAGVGLSIPHVEVTTLPGSIAGSTKTFEYQVAGGVVQALAGVSYEFADNWRLFGEYKLSYTWNNAALTDSDFTFQTNLVSHHVLAGLSYSFPAGDW